MLPTLSLPLTSSPLPSSPAVPAPSPPAPPALSQTEIKKAQNRKSAKRFREAQKQRWKNMADDLMSHKRTIDELRAQLAAQATTVAHANSALRAAQHIQQQSQQSQLSYDHLGTTGSSADAKRSSVSIHDLVDADAKAHELSSAHTHAEAEAALYAQILSSKAHGSGSSSACSDDANHSHSGSSSLIDVSGPSAKQTDNLISKKHHRLAESSINGDEPYAKQLGILTWCLVVDRASCKIVSVRRGNADGVGALATDGLALDDLTEYRNALLCAKAVAVRCSRNGQRRNVVMNPVEGCDRVVVAEFTPL